MINTYIPERRRTRRIQCKHLTSYRYYYPSRNHLGPKEFKALTIDISESGASLVSAQKVRPGSNILIKFSIHKEVDPRRMVFRKFILFPGLVVYANPAGDSCFRLGIYFGQPTQKNEIKFFDIVCSPSFVYDDQGSQRLLRASRYPAN